MVNQSTQTDEHEFNNSCYVFLFICSIIVAVGGVFDVDSYNEKFELGADLVQMYTGLIYEGPNLVKRIVKNDKQISSNS